MINYLQLSYPFNLVNDIGVQSFFGSFAAKLTIILEKFDVHLPVSPLGA